jgi:hypothetical protein
MLHLTQIGYKVTVFEVDKEPGGMTMVGVPVFAFRWKGCRAETLERTFELRVRPWTGSSDVNRIGGRQLRHDMHSSGGEKTVKQNPRNLNCSPS